VRASAGIRRRTSAGASSSTSRAPLPGRRGERDADPRIRRHPRDDLAGDPRGLPAAGTACDDPQARRGRLHPRAQLSRDPFLRVGVAPKLQEPVAEDQRTPFLRCSGEATLAQRARPLRPLRLIVYRKRAVPLAPSCGESDDGRCGEVGITTRHPGTADEHRCQRLVDRIGPLDGGGLGVHRPAPPSARSSASISATEGVSRYHPVG